MTTETTPAPLPSDAELMAAIEAAKGAGVSSSDIKHTDHGAALARHFLAPRFHALSLDYVRTRAENLSRAGREPGACKRPRKASAEAAVERIRRAYPPPLTRSPEYEELHRGERWRSHLRMLKKELDYRCQMCFRQFPGEALEGHCLDYADFEAYGRTMIYCLPHHALADALLRMDRDVGGAEEPLPLWAANGEG